MEGKILLVDDNAEFIDSMKDILEDEGYEIQTATSGPDAIALTGKMPFDLVLMDIKMPGMNGVECFLKMKEQNPMVRVILFTAYAVSELIQKAQDEGVCAILKKPLDMDLFTYTIKKVKEKNTNACILVVDDDQALCDNLKDALTESGHRVITAKDGSRAVNAASEKNFDIMLLDMKLPGTNGLEVYRKVKQLHPQMVTVIMTGYGVEMKEMIDQCIHENAYTYLAKPLQMPQLMELIQQIALLQKKESLSG